MSWFIDERESFTRYFKQEEGSELSVTEIDLRQVLEESLEKLVAWNREDLVPHDAKNPWADYSKEEWEKIWSLDRYPMLKL